MRVSYCPLLTLVMVPALMASAAGRVAAPTDLRCELISDPLGIDMSQPRLSWLLHSKGRNEIQSAYQVLVASSREWLNRNRGDRWDSGRVPSDSTLNVSTGEEH